MTVNPVFDALTVNGQISGGGNAVAITATNSVSARTAANRFADVFNVKDYNALGDGTTNDTPAINACITAAKAWQSTQPVDVSDGAGRPAPVRILFPAGFYHLTSTINLTNAIAFTISAEGAVLYGAVSGRPVVDAMGARYLNIRSLTIEGDPTYVPTIGIQIGRTGNAGFTSADNQHFDNVAIRGNFTVACLYNMACETSTFIRLQAWNAATGYGVVQDGWFHAAFGVTSQFIALNLVNDPALAYSFNENMFVNADIRSNGSGIWMGSCQRHSWIGSYNASNGHGHVMYAPTSALQSTMLMMDMHVELADYSYWFTGNAGHNCYNWVIKDQNCASNVAVFGMDTMVVGVSMAHPRIEIAYFQNPSCVWFDQPSKYGLYGGAIYSEGAWPTPPIVFTGYTVFGFTQTFYGLKSGDAPNFAGNTQLAGLLVGTGAGSSPPFQFRSAAGNPREVLYLSGTAARWGMYVDGSNESGGNAGSNWSLRRYNDAGTVIDAPITVNRQSGIPAFPNGTQVGGSFQFSASGSPVGVVGALVGSTWARTDGASGTTLYVKESGTGGMGGWSTVLTTGTPSINLTGTATVAGLLTANAGLTATTLQAGGNAATSASITSNTATGYSKGTYHLTGGVLRWGMVTDPTAESGGNTGSNFVLTRYSDVGSVIDYPIVVNRASGIPSFSNGLQVGVSGIFFFSGAGSPSGVISGPVGSLYTRTDGGTGTTLYVKESGTGNTGWIAK